MPDHNSTDRVFRLLYVEDSPSDVFLVQEALKNFRPSIELTVMDSGEKAISYLQQQNGYERVARPHLVLLDLNLPIMKGEEVLLTIKADPQLKAVPVVVFTSAANELTCKPIYHQNANTCVRKPADLDSFLDTVQQTCHYWFSIANLPAMN